MKRVILWLLKAILAGVTAFAILTGFCSLYYNMPVHHDTTDGATDYSWDRNKFYSRATEGFAWGKTNNEGYLNPFDYSENDEIDILVVGSSHMEAYQVAMDESTAAVLGKLLPGNTVYNIGTSGHDFLVCADNLSAAVAKYNPTRYVLLEISSLQYTDEQLISAISGDVPHLSSSDSGIIGLLQKNPFLRLMYSQFQSYAAPAGTAPANSHPVPQVTGKETLYNELISKLHNTVCQNGAQLIIVYHPHLSIKENGEAYIADDPQLSTFFSDICQKNGVKFLDMSSTFMNAYQSTHTLPHGFINTTVGSGHLNKDGHAMIAHAIYKLIAEEE